MMLRDMKIFWYICQIYSGQGSPHTGREWSAPTTSQQFLPPLRLDLPPLIDGKKVLKSMLNAIRQYFAQV